MHSDGSSALGLNWDDARLFLAVCRSRTVGEAAKELGVNGSTVSRRLVTLEETLGATLFDRGRNGVTPTQAAEDLLPVAEQMEHVMARFTGLAETFERDVAGVVRITCPSDVADVLVVPLLPALLERHPELRIDLQVGEGLVDIARRAADLALRVVRPTSGDLTVTKLLTATWIPVGSAQRVRSLGRVKSWQAVPWISCGDRLRDSTPARWLDQQAPGVDPRVRSDDVSTEVSAVAAGLGIAMLPDRTAAHYGFVPVEMSKELAAQTGPWPQDDLFMVAHRALREVPRVRAVWHYMLEAAAGRSTSGGR